jgi:putative addiction module component (TIGR02574 family)
MPNAIELLEAEALKLPLAERSRLAERLLVSLDEDETQEDEWDALADAREVDLASGKVQPVPLEEALTRLQARFPG